MKPGQKAGEASAWYLFSEVAAGRIYSDNPEARIVVCLRDPATAAESLYRQLRIGFREDQPTFRAAWKIQEQRAQGIALPVYCPEPRQLQYRAVYSYASQLERLFSKFCQTRVFIIIVEELKYWGREITKELFEFLDVRDSGQYLDQFKSNERQTYRFNWIQDTISRPPRGLRPMVTPVKKVLNAAGITPSMLMLKMLGSRISSHPVEDGFLDVVREEFEADVSRVEAILGVDLPCWRCEGQGRNEPPARILRRGRRTDI